MGKAPAFQFYVRDWLSDPAVRRCTPASRGIWIDLLCFMWESPERGEITARPEDLARMTGATEAEIETFLQEAEVTQMSRVTWRDNFVTIENRRMVRDRNAKEISRLSSQRHREKQQRDTKVTPPSSSSSLSSPSVPNKHVELDPEIEYLRRTAKEVLELLNSEVGGKYRPTDGTLAPILARLREGFGLEDFATVIRGQKMDPYFQANPKFFRPSTLFGNKFAGYLQAAPKLKVVQSVGERGLKTGMATQRFLDNFEDEPKQIEEGRANDPRGPRRLR